MEFARQLIMFGSGKTNGIFKCRASIWNDYSQAEARQSMKYLACKAFQCARLGPDVGAVMLKTTIPNMGKPMVKPSPQYGASEVQQLPREWGYGASRSSALPECRSPCWAQTGLAGHRHQSLSCNSTCQIMLPLAPLSQISVAESIFL